MSEQVFDLEEFLERVQNDKELLLELIDIFTADFKEKRILLEEAIKNSNCEEVKSIAHSLKGASGNISAKDLRETLLTLEQMGKESDLSQAQGELEALDTKFAALSSRLENLAQELG